MSSTMSNDILGELRQIKEILLRIEARGNQLS
jgi:hypothetical protein